MLTNERFVKVVWDLVLFRAQTIATERKRAETEQWNECVKQAARELISDVSRLSGFKTVIR